MNRTIRKSSTLYQSQIAFELNVRYKKMTTQTISVNVNLNGLLGELQSSIQKVICLVAAGLNATIDVEPDELVLPATMKSTFGRRGLSKEQFNIEYSEWIISNGFRDAIESVSSFLESAHRVLSIWELIEKQQGGTPISGKEWNSLSLDAGNKFHRLGLPDKLEHIENAQGIEIGELYKEQILSINVARNCFVHRKGVVSDRDVNDDGQLKVKWSRLRTVLQNEDGEQDLVLGQLVEKESTLCVRFEENEKAFELGDQLAFSVDEVSEILWCFFLFGNDLVVKISSFGEERGHIQATEEGSA